MTGPLIGSALYELFGFEFTFYVYGAAEILLGIVVWFKVKNNPLLQQNTEVEENLNVCGSVMEEVSREVSSATNDEA